MPSHTPARRPRQPLPGPHVGNSHLALTVAILTAILAGLIIVAYFYVRKTPPTVTNVNVNAPGSINPASLPVADTPINTRVFTGTVREVTGNRVAVTTAVVDNGTSGNRTILVTTTAATVIAKLGPVSTQIPIGNVPVPPREQTTASLSDLTVGTDVEVTATEIVNTTLSVTAESIFILTE